MTNTTMSLATEKALPDHEIYTMPDVTVESFDSVTYATGKMFANYPPERDEDEDTDMFTPYTDDFLDFESVENKLSARPDLHAFIMLDQMAPDIGDVVLSAGHDEIWLSFDLEKIKLIATANQLRDLHRCGIRVDDDGEGLCMFV